MNVLSLFDGMSCGQVALDELGIKFTPQHPEDELKKAGVEFLSTSKFK